MNQKILFSPVGGTDPISSTNCRDGSLLHICRVYQPNKVILYMSWEMLENHEKDNRYLYCLDRLAENQSRKMEYEIIRRPELTKVHEFDYFYQDFREIIENVFEQMDETDSFLLNISSGTPAMKSGLAVLQTMGEFPCTLVQVATPEKRINEHVHKDYDVKALWEKNEDNQENFENRCKEIKCPTLSAIKNEEIIKKHIAVYDYQAAYAVAQSMPAVYTASYIDLLELGVYRILLDFSEVDRLLGNQRLYSLPVEEKDSRKYFEYALNLNVRLQRKEYADFVRALTPLIVDLLEMVLKKQTGIDINEYCFWENTVRKWDRNKLAGNVILEKLNEKYNNKFRYGPVYSGHLNTLIQQLSPDARLKELADDLRNIERSIRNLAAHNIVSITDERIKNETGFTGKQIMDIIKSMFSYTDIPVKKEYWNSYDDMNEVILKTMEGKA